MDTPSSDRYIPLRDDMDIELCNHNLCFKRNESVLTPPLYKTMDKKLFSKAEPKKILSFKEKAPLPQNVQSNSNMVLFSCSTKKKYQRKISPYPELTLEAPCLEDDFYLNLLDWSSRNILAIGLQNDLFMWNGNNGDISKIECPESSKITSVSWTPDGSNIAIGNDMNTIEIWDIERMILLRKLKSHKSRVSSLTWNKYILSSGSKDTTICNHDVRVPNHLLSSYTHHSAEVCGLKWSPRGTQLASGSNDNILAIWDSRMLKQPNINCLNTPLFNLCSHEAAVKAIAWAPFQADLIASGGGTNDRKIRFWNTQTGIELDSIDTGSQICSLQWAKNDSREIISSHGYAKNELKIWKYPSLKQIGCDLVGHTKRVLHMSLSPDGTTIATAAADEKLCFWNVFTKPSSSRSSHKINTLKTRSIR